MLAKVPMVTKALQSGACIFVVSYVVKATLLYSHGKHSVPICVISCKNNISNIKPHVLTNNTTRFQTWNKVLLDQWRMLHKFLFTVKSMPIGKSCLFLWLIIHLHLQFFTFSYNCSILHLEVQLLSPFTFFQWIFMLQLNYSLILQFTVLVKLVLHVFFY